MTQNIVLAVWKVGQFCYDDWDSRCRLIGDVPNSGPKLRPNVFIHTIDWTIWRPLRWESFQPLTESPPISSPPHALPGVVRRRRATQLIRSCRNVNRSNGWFILNIKSDDFTINQYVHFDGSLSSLTKFDGSSPGSPSLAPRAFGKARESVAVLKRTCYLWFFVIVRSKGKYVIFECERGMRKSDGGKMLSLTDVQL